VVERRSDVEARYDARMPRPDVLVIGAGVVGASVAYHLAARGCRNVRVVDRAERPGAGSTGHATGGFRTQFGSAINVRLSLLAREKLLRFEDETGVDPGYRQAGYLFLARTEATLEILRQAQTIQHACGVFEAQMIDAVEARALNHAIEDEAVVGGTFCPTDGFVRPLNLLRGYVEAAQRLGVRFDFGVEIAAIDGQDAGAIVNAAGAWAAALGAPVTPLRRKVACTAATDLLPESTPMTIWADDGFHLRVRDGRVLLLWPDSPPVNDEAWFARVERFTRERVPLLRDLAIDRTQCWSGLYEMSPDRHAILGRWRDNVYLANGSSGHGVMHAPAIGHLLAEVILDGRATTLDIEELRPSRFEEGLAIESPTLL
jgi:sarcosine oxidase subunit beta